MNTSKTPSKKVADNGLPEFKVRSHIDLVVAVRVTKPLVPPQISQTYIDREVERTKLLIQREEQKLISKRSEIEKRLNKIRAEGENNVSIINNKVLLAER